MQTTQESVEDISLPQTAICLANDNWETDLVKWEGVWVVGTHVFPSKFTGSSITSVHWWPLSFLDHTFQSPSQWVVLSSWSIIDLIIKQLLQGYINSLVSLTAVVRIVYRSVKTSLLSRLCQWAAESLWEVSWLSSIWPQPSFSFSMVTCIAELSYSYSATKLFNWTNVFVPIYTSGGRIMYP